MPGTQTAPVDAADRTFTPPAIFDTRVTEGAEAAADYARHNIHRRVADTGQRVRLIVRMAACDATFLMQGETGIGKELAVGQSTIWAPRSSAPFIPVNCAALPETLVESELFGHVRGAFTDAGEARRGVVAQAEVLANVLRRYSAEYRQPSTTLDIESLAWLRQHQWPGNVRELENLVHRQLLLGDSSELHLAAPKPREARATQSDMSFRDAKARAIADFERCYIFAMLARTGGNISFAARLAGEERSGLASWQRSTDWTDGVLPCRASPLQKRKRR